MIIRALIPSRSGTTGCPRKNENDFIEGLTLTHIAADLADDSGTFDSIHVSTDIERLLNEDWEARGIYGVVVNERPAHLATNNALIWDVLKDLNESYPADMWVLLNPTSPLRTATTIHETIRAARLSGQIAMTARYSTRWAYYVAQGRIPAYGRDGRIANRQPIEPAPEIHAACQAIPARFLEDDALSCYPYVIVPTDDAEAVDIDTPMDLRVARALYSERLPKAKKGQ